MVLQVQPRHPNHSQSLQQIFSNQCMSLPFSRMMSIVLCTKITHNIAFYMQGLPIL